MLNVTLRWRYDCVSNAVDHKSRDLNYIYFPLSTTPRYWHGVHGQYTIWLSDRGEEREDKWGRRPSYAAEGPRKQAKLGERLCEAIDWAIRRFYHANNVMWHTTNASLTPTLIWTMIYRLFSVFWASVAPKLSFYTTHRHGVQYMVSKWFDWAIA